MRALFPSLAVLSLIAAAPAMAQGVTLVSATPAANGAASGIRTLSLSFSAPLVEKQSGVEIAMTGMPGMANHKPMAVSGFTTALTAEGRTLVLTLPRALPVGTYSLSWHAVTTDGRRGEGRYSFSAR